jgi:hypothetical protein
MPEHALKIQSPNLPSPLRGEEWFGLFLPNGKKDILGFSPEKDGF